MTRRDRDGMVLLNVLLMLAVASVAVLVMVTAQDIEVQRTTRLREAAQAGAYARAGELSAVTELRRDALTAAGTDNLTEPWAAIGQQSIAVPGGRFSLTIQDEQARFNVNALVGGEAQPIALFQRIGAQAGVEPDVMVLIANIVRIAGPLSDLGLLRTGGISPDDLTRLDPWIIALPAEATINLNTVAEPLLVVMTDDPDSARALIQRRAQAGLLQPADLATAGIGALPGSGFTSDHYRVVTAVTVGETSQTLTSRLERQRRQNGVDVLVRARGRTAG